MWLHCSAFAIVYQFSMVICVQYPKKRKAEIDNAKCTKYCPASAS